MKTQKCEFPKCRAKATQADTNLNMWLCDNHYSKIDSVNKTDDELEKIEAGMAVINCI